MHNMQRQMLLPEACQFLALDCGAIQGAHSNAPLTGISGVFLDVPGQHPAEIGEAI